MKPLSKSVDSLLAISILLGASTVPRALFADPRLLDEAFPAVVQPFLRKYCLDCHGSTSPEAKLDLSGFRTTADVRRGFATWMLVMQRLRAGEMPPEDASLQPGESERQAVVSWIAEYRADFAKRHAGDPGDVLARRLSSAEYNYTIRDLTGVAIDPAREFPVDPANEAGFDNSGESLSMTPALLKKYLDAARLVASHLVFKPDGLAFAPHPVISETDRDKYAVRRIVDFYHRQNTNLADYLFAAWELGLERDVSPEQIKQQAAKGGLSDKYLATIWELLHSTEHDQGPIRQLRQRWSLLPRDPGVASEVLPSCRELAGYVREVRKQLAFDFPHLRVEGINPGSQTLVLWRNRQYATHRMRLNRDVLFSRETNDTAGDSQKQSSRNADSQASRKFPELAIPADESEQPAFLAALEHFCRTFPDEYYVATRGREYVNRKDSEELEKEREVRLLSAGFHSMMGYFRDDQPLVELLLDEPQRTELDRLWLELDYITRAPFRQHAGFIWFERAEGRYLVDAEFDEFRSEDQNAASEPMISRLRDAYLAKAQRLGASELAVQAMRDHFRIINQTLRAVEALEPSARAAHVRDLQQLAERAYRRPLLDSERQQLDQDYRQMIERDGLTHEQAVRDVLASILLSPHFCFRLQPSELAEPIHPLNGYALASRLSYFLWSSMPDVELMRLAAAGRLSDLEVLRAQTRRMLADVRARGWAIEFGTQWLDIRRFPFHNAVDRQRFPQFDNELREAMFEEPVQFLLDVVRQDRSLLECLYADHTFVNGALAKHYGIELPRQNDEWVRINDAHRYGRGGLLPMAVFLTKNSPGLRTSPVKRGYWVVRQLLGERIPAPPPNVPELPADETKLGELTLREVLARHRENKSCAGCHDRFDSIGLVFEGFGPIGERRTADGAGKPVETAASMPDGDLREGVAGLRDYLRDRRQDEFIENLCRKLLSYALGRSLILSDDPTIETMRGNLVQGEYRFQTLIEDIVTSRQFLYQRGSSFQEP